jgi:hypothetical protein
MRKKTHEEFVEELKQKQPDIVCIEKYINIKTKIRFKHIPCGTEFKYEPNEILRDRNGTRCPTCSRLYNGVTHEKFIIKLRTLQPNIECLGTYINSETKILFRHSCGYEWMGLPKDILQLKHCPNCYNKYTSEEFMIKLKQLRPDITCLGEYLGYTTPILFRHSCGHEWTITPKTILSTKTCPICCTHTKWTHTAFIERLSIQQPDIICLDTYINNKTPIRFKHTCGYVWKCIPQTVLVRIGKCPKCSNKISSGERSVRDILLKNNIYFEPEKVFINCVHISPLPFDFYIPELNVCIEYQGIQHFKAIEYWGGEIEFEKRKHRDQIKRNFCRDNNISLLEIKYDEDVENVLSEYFANTTVNPACQYPKN